MFFVFVKAKDGQTGNERKYKKMRGKAGGERHGWTASALREDEGSERGKLWLCFKEQKTEGEHLTHMISIKDYATCR